MVTNLTDTKANHTVSLENAPDDQSTEARKERINKCHCPVHDRLMVQNDVWYTPRSGKRFTFVACMDVKCRIELLASEGFKKTELPKSWNFLLNQDDSGSAKVIVGDFGKS